MTNKEAIAIIENEKRCVNRADHCNRDCYNCELVKTDTEILTALNMAIESLKQESILDKIKAEVMDKSYLSYDDNPRSIIDESWVLEIIDKSVSESEG